MIRSFCATFLLLVTVVASLAQTAPNHEYYLKVRAAINPSDGRVVENAIVQIASGRILNIGSADQLAPPPGANVRDFSDKFLIPGLVDTHAHLYTSLVFSHSTNAAVPPMLLAGGVTSILSPGSGDPEGDIALKNRVDSGRIAGPRMFLAGEYIDMEPLRVPWMEPVGTESEARTKLDRWFERGAGAVKVYTGTKGNILRFVISYAHQRGVKVSGHLEDTSWGDAITMGIDVIHHGIYSFPEVMPPGIPAQAIGMVNFAPPEYDRFYQAIVDADLKSPKIASVFRAAAASRVVFVPTVVALYPNNLANDRMEIQQALYSPDGWKKVENRANSEKRKFAKLLAEKNIEFVREAHRAGVPLATGTDLTTLQILPGFSIHREMELFAAAGLSPMEVLRAATWNGAWAIGRTDLFGSLEPGKAADFVLLDADPLENVSNVRKIHRVVKNGIIFDPNELLKPLKGRIH